VFEQIWNYLKVHDLPNWIVLCFSLIVWPIVLYLWNRRTYSSIRNLQIIVDPAGGVIPTGESCPYLVFRFENKTGENVYIANATIKVTDLINPHPNADKDLSTGNYALKFAEREGESFFRLQTTINTGNRVTTGLPLSESYSKEDGLKSLINTLRSHKSNRLFSKYFTLQFDTMIGGKHRGIRFKF
jgi:hypothetical protein